MYSRSSSQDEFFTIYGNDIHDTGNSEEMRPSKFNASEEPKKQYSISKSDIQLLRRASLALEILLPRKA
ncbi:hypothetical protein CEXT_389981 [Caerostris extrusa]|uniref:Uncharacterized protein n=1 Tax=Caerostris extrusa TaxID=172846 RepID=A0AAV4Q193_CAEEX|nr:hypothetical protein CEXT_389981 [Caerostris extrusa]